MIGKKNITHPKLNDTKNSNEMTTGSDFNDAYNNDITHITGITDNPLASFDSKDITTTSASGSRFTLANSDILKNPVNWAYINMENFHRLGRVITDIADWIDLVQNTTKENNSQLALAFDSIDKKFDEIKNDILSGSSKGSISKNISPLFTNPPASMFADYFVYTDRDIVMSVSRIIDKIKDVIDISNDDGSLIAVLTPDNIPDDIIEDVHLVERYLKYDTTQNRFVSEVDGVSVPIRYVKPLDKTQHVADRNDLSNFSVLSDMYPGEYTTRVYDSTSEFDTRTTLPTQKSYVASSDENMNEKIVLMENITGVMSVGGNILDIDGAGHSVKRLNIRTTKHIVSGVSQRRKTLVLRNITVIDTITIEGDIKIDRIVFDNCVLPNVIIKTAKNVTILETKCLTLVVGGEIDYLHVKNVSCPSINILSESRTSIMKVYSKNVDNIRIDGTSIVSMKTKDFIDNYTIRKIDMVVQK